MMPLRVDWRATGRVVVVLVSLLVVLVVAWHSGLFAIHDRARLVEFVAGLRDRPQLIPAFIAIYAITAAAGVPVTPLTLAGGVLFGATRGVAINWLAETVAAALAFGAIRFAGTAQRRLRMSGRTLFRLRLIPVVPFAFLNAGAALSDMSWPTYTLATAVGIIPVTVIYTVSAAGLIAGVEGSGSRALLEAIACAAALIAVSFLLPRLRSSTAKPQ